MTGFLPLGLEEGREMLTLPCLDLRVISQTASYICLFQPIMGWVCLSGRGLLFSWHPKVGSFLFFSCSSLSSAAKVANLIGKDAGNVMAWGDEGNILFFLFCPSKINVNFPLQKKVRSFDFGSGTKAFSTLGCRLE